MTRLKLSTPEPDASATEADLFLWEELARDASALLERSLSTDEKIDGKQLHQTMARRYMALAEERRASSVFKDIHGLRDRLDALAESVSETVWQLVMSELQKRAGAEPSSDVTFMVECYSSLRRDQRTDAAAVEQFLRRANVSELQKLAQGARA